MKLYASCGHTFDLPGVNHPDAVKCATCGHIVAVWAVDLKDQKPASAMSVRGRDAGGGGAHG